MTTSKSVCKSDVFDILQDLSNTRDALTAFNVILTDAFNENENYKSHAWGIYHLMQTQLDDLSRIEDCLREQFKTASESGSQDTEFRELLRSLAISDDIVAPRLVDQAEMRMLAEKTAENVQEKPVYSDGDIEAIARLAGVHQGAAARVMFVLTGKDLAGDAYKREGDFGTYRLDRHLLERRVYDVLNSGVEWGRVSLKTGLDLHTVQEVFLSMLNSPAVEAMPRPIENIREDLYRVGTKLGLDANTVYNVAVGLAIPDSIETDATETPAAERTGPVEMRKEFIADKIKDGVDAGQIAQALNMRKATVERVIRQLMAEPGQSDAPEQQVANG